MASEPTRRRSRPIDLNAASRDQLVDLGMPAELADAILRFRDEYGPFGSVDSLRIIPGVSDQDYKRWHARLSV